ncbi:bone morphogenetic protein 10 [Heteronotia binoei]|uniref:bone morphogenetic protein 10 n=1 Tax=Heteronotia binoei TaxID=13085 RepID=UPI00292FA070|nr:bone morphogenetic protein 10 [Heteronotia binoei]
MDSVAFQIWAALTFLVHLANCSPIMSLDVPLLEEDMPFFDEQDALLQNLQNALLKALNLSDIPTQEAVKVDPPEYMLELYNRFATDKTSMPSANIVRSFKNEEQILYPVHFNGIRRYPLLFNISIPRHEKITMAELRLYTLGEDARMLYGGSDRKVTIFEVLENEHGEGKKKGEKKMKVLASRHIHSTDNEWKTFEVTEAIRKWHHSDSTTHRLEVQIENRGGEEPNGGVKVDIDINVEAKNEPLLIVFSDDQGHDKKEGKHELNEMIEHEQMQDLQDLDMNDFYTRPSEEKLLQIRSNIIYDSTSRIRRNAGSSCKRTSLLVDFKEIGWDSWIIAPQTYEAYQCKGACSYPLDDQVTTTYAMARTLVHLNDPQKASPACCVPTKLAPISLLYLDKGVVTYKLNYDDMSVLECGCR